MTYPCTGPDCPACAQGGWTVSRRRWVWLRLTAKLAHYRDRLRARYRRWMAGP